MERRALDLEHYPNVERKRAVISETLKESGTPVFLCDAQIVRDRFHTLKICMDNQWPKSAIGYSFKTNYWIAQCGLAKELGAWAEVVSGHEYQLACNLGFAEDQIIYNGPCKSDVTLRKALLAGSLTNINDSDELDRVIAISEAAGRQLSVGIRISAMFPSGEESRFGFSMENDEASQAVRKIAACEGLKLTGIHTHLYGDTDEPEMYFEAARRLAVFAKTNIADYLESLEYLDLGGGFPAHSPKPKSRDEWHPREVGHYIGQICDGLLPYFPNDARRPMLIVEPGRYMTADGIVFVSQVVHVKERAGRQMVNTNGSISMVPLTHYCPQVIHAYTPELREKTGREMSSIVYGGTCRENDILYQGMFPEVVAGDLLIHFAAGAYNSSLSPAFIFPSPEMRLI
ncbi:MAG: hypothetical protein R3E01_25945 [Pirellulaceae bacterium]|nr:hypothetical protein [Planctomycetales bacterium]